MKKLTHLLNYSLWSIVFSFFCIYNTSAQCTITALTMDTIINCDDSVVVNLSGFADFALNNDFNLGTAGAGWQATSSAQYDNPYIPSLDNSTYLWMGNMADVPRTLTSNPLDLGFGGLICFDLAMAVQGDPAPTEGPDLSEEGISLQYSTDGGLTWVDIVYFQPDGQILPANPGPGGPNAAGQTPFTQWGNYCFPIPAGAQTTNTSIQWAQLFSSTTNFDHWGLDNIQIFVNDPLYNFYLVNNNTQIDTNLSVVYPNTDSLFTYIYTNGIDDTCTALVDVVVNPTDAGPDIIASCDGIGEPIEVTGVSPWSTITWSPGAGLTNGVNSIENFANPIDDQLYTVTSNCGVDSIFVDVVPTFEPSIAVPDTICLYDQTPLVLSTTPANVTIATVDWTDASTLSSPSGSTVMASPYVTTTYFVVAESDSGCTRLDTTTVFVDGILTPIEINPMDTQVCVGDPAELSADFFQQTPLFYDVQSVGYSPVTNPGTGTMITGLADDEISGPLPLGFEFDFYGNPFTEVFLSSNGWLRFGFSTDPDPSQDAIPSANGNENIIAFAWTDLNFPNGGTAEYYTIGTSPNSAFVMEFSNVAHDGNSMITVTVQVILYESGIIQINNIDIQSDGGGMTQGVENITASEGSVVPGHNNTPFDAQNESWMFIPYAPFETPIYNWSPATYLNSTTDSLVISTPLADETYTVTVDNGYCSATATTTVFIDTTNITFPMDVTSCSSADTIQMEVLTNASLNTDCNYTLNMFDGASAAWFGAESVDVFIDNVLFNSYAHSGGASSSVTFNVPSGSTLSLGYNPSLSSADNSYELVNYDGDVTFADGPGPSPGIVHTELSCNGGFMYDWESTNGATFNDTALSNPEIYTTGSDTFNITVTNRVGCVFTHTAYFTVESGFLLEVTNDTIICAGDNLQLIASPGADTYSWSPNMDITDITVNNPVVNPSSTATYTVTVDSAGCTASDMVTIEVSTIGIDSVPATDISCAAPGELIIYATNAIPSYTYSIDNLSYFPSDTFVIPAAGNYTVSVQDTVGCIASQVVAVGQIGAFVIDAFAHTDNTCFGDSAGTITFSGMGGTPPYEYSIDNGVTYQATGNFNNLGAGTYTIILRDAQLCNSNFETITVLEPNELILSLDNVVGANCGVADGSLLVNASGGTGAYTYTLDGGASQASGSFNMLGGNTYELVVTDGNTCADTLDVLVPQSSDVAISLISFDSITCNGDMDASIVVSVSAGTQPYALTLNSVTIGAGTDTSFTNLDGGLYTVEVTDSLGCTANVSATIFEPAVLDVTSIPSSVSCFGGNDGVINLTATGGTLPLSYSITNDADLTGATTFNTLTAATYQAYVVDDNGCRDTVSTQVIQPNAALEFDQIAVQNILCFGDNDGQFTVNMIGGTAPYTYSTDGITYQMSNTLSGLNGGNFTIYVRDDNGCTIDSTNNLITEPTDLTLTLTSTTPVSCNNGADGAISVAAGGGNPPYSYSIGGPAQVSSDFNNLAANTYIVTVTDSTGCTEQITTTLNNPSSVVPSITTTPIACSGDLNGIITIDNVVGGSGPYTISFESAAAVPLMGNNVFAGLGEGIYAVEIFDTLNCSSGVINVNLNNPNVLAITSIDVQNVSCFGLTDAEITVNAVGGSGNITYNLNTAIGDTTVNNTGVFGGLSANISGYPIWVEDANGCLVQDTVVVTEPDEISIDSVYLNELTCFGYNDAFIEVYGAGGGGQGSYDFTLQDGTQAQNDLVFSGLSSGVYWIYLTDVNGCQDSVQVPIVNPTPVQAHILADTTLISMGDSIELEAILDSSTGGLTYSWIPGVGLTCTDCSNPTVLVFNDEMFTVTITDSLGCYDDASINVEVIDSLYYFVPNAFTPSNDDNMNEVFKAYGQDMKFVEMMVFNRWGEKVHESNSPFEGWDGTYKGVMQQPGVFTYFMEITFLNDRTVALKGSVTLIR